MEKGNMDKPEYLKLVYSSEGISENPIILNTFTIFHLSFSSSSISILL